MLTVIVGLTVALVYGAADFVGGVAGRRLPVAVVTALSATAGLIVVSAIALPLLGGTWSPEAVLWGAVSALVGATALPLLYAALALGPMSIVSPLAALLGAIVPMAWGLVQGERLGPLGPVALGAALVAVVLVGFVPPPRDPAHPGRRLPLVRPSLKALLAATAAGLLLGVFIVIFDQTPDDSGVVPLAVNRAGMMLLLWPVAAVLLTRMRRRARERTAGDTADSVESLDSLESDTLPRARVAPAPLLARRTLLLAALGGALDTTANALILVGLRLGDLSVMGVLTAMYPAGTILLAAVVLGERITRVQWIGLALALAAAGMLALA
ncbi:EamA family transporter [Schumannella sp. 10F1B-5-1]|uniref:EamA family transporter n=1 Tax=Schumannella sp. 10F1B-5-1 TaxID=2590780 RepID=UPI0011313975|nr:EamA family transporter [Schumannella sp. 10F1B-5-1]TPW76943.1 EamA family transporter [Schumannella sp. 10F1B-5-1]